MNPYDPALRESMRDRSQARGYSYLRSKLAIRASTLVEVKGVASGLALVIARRVHALRAHPVVPQPDVQVHPLVNVLLTVRQDDSCAGVVNH